MKSLRDETAVTGRIFQETFPSLFFIQRWKLQFNGADIISPGPFRTATRSVATVKVNSSFSLASSLAITRNCSLTASSRPGDTFSRLSNSFKLVIFVLHCSS